MPPIHTDERVATRWDRTAGYLGPRASTFTLAWLASHRDRLRTLILGGKRLSVLFIWDTKGAQEAERTDPDMDAIYQLVYGDAGPPVRPFTEPLDDAPSNQERHSEHDPSPPATPPA